MSDTEYRYRVDFTINVQRADGKMLTNDENAMVEKMRVATNAAIAKVMADHGHNLKKQLHQKKVIY